jgi:predicted nucleic acid-binding protein
MRKNTEITKFFLDTTIIISAITGRSLKCVEILENRNFTLYTNEYAIKEVRRILSGVFQFTTKEINENVEYIESKCIIPPKPSKNDIKNIKISDKSDTPIVSSALKLKIPLVIDDHRTYIDAKKYVQTLKSDEI